MLEEVETTSSGWWNSFLYVHGRTEELYMERDCAYTLITVPPSSAQKDILLCNKLVFLFQIGNKEQLMFPLVSNNFFVYNGKFLTHQQEYNPIATNSTDIFSTHHLMETKNIQPFTSEICTNDNRRIMNKNY